MVDNSQEVFKRDDLIVPAFVVGMAVGGIGSSKIIHIFNKTDEYNPLHNQVLELQQDNNEIEIVAEDQHLKGFEGQRAVQNHLERLNSQNDKKIATLQAKEPEQVISPGAETGIEAGSALLAGALVFAWFVKRARAQRAARESGRTSYITSN